MDALIFIDTNIFLDFYRIRNTDISLKYLDLINKNHDKIITGSQIEMEYKKNRQSVILDSFGKIKTPNWESLTPPAIVSDAKPSEIIERSKKQIVSQQKKIKDRITKILKNPTGNDPVYQTLQRLFKNNCAYNLNRGNKLRHQVRFKAKKRFILGYPPRKKDDISIGDCYNWEWIIHCAETTKKHIIIVSRDGDYGIMFNKEAYLNDFLLQEFKERISQQRKIILTDRLSWAFREVQQVVTNEMIAEEERIIESAGDHPQFTPDDVRDFLLDIEKSKNK